MLAETHIGPPAEPESDDAWFTKREIENFRVAYTNAEFVGGSEEQTKILITVGELAASTMSFPRVPDWHNQIGSDRKKSVNQFTNEAERLFEEGNVILGMRYATSISEAVGFLHPKTVEILRRAIGASEFQETRPVLCRQLGMLTIGLIDHNRALTRLGAPSRISMFETPRTKRQNTSEGRVLFSGDQLFSRTPWIHVRVAKDETIVRGWQIGAYLASEDMKDENMQKIAALVHEYKAASQCGDEKAALHALSALGWKMIELDLQPNGDDMPLRPQGAAQMKHLQLVASANMPVEPRAVFRAARDMSILAGYPRNESIILLRKLLDRLPQMEWIAWETRNTLRQESIKLLGLYAANEIQISIASTPKEEHQASITKWSAEGVLRLIPGLPRIDYSSQTLYTSL